MFPTRRIPPTFFICHLLIAWVGFSFISPVEVECAGPRYPSDFAMDPENRFLFTANRGSRSISVLDIRSGNRIQELERGPDALPAKILAYLRNEKLEVALSDEAGHCVRIFSWKNGSPAPLRQEREVPAGRQPQGLAYHPASGQLFVASAEKGEIWVIDPGRELATAQIPTVEGARNLLIVSKKDSPGG